MSFPEYTAKAKLTCNPAGDLMGDNPVASTCALNYTSGHFFLGGGLMRPRSLDEFLTKARVPYTTFRHAPAFTAMHAAAISHVPGRSWAKTVVCCADGEMVLAVVPAHYTIDLERLCALAGAAALRLASECEIC